ncbi:asparagine synthase [Halosimplex carlsbadense 2-9-1]|uniref:Asparagine synthase n=1 Tax=Halosimplex carlsbadense 2-9-1 TaxID=797114 RepID=M0CG56_9EURY|nr:asparagine synthase-related protein [Halosimplex carlsbadense]ELZ22255.1 asparagine synthase [Halosimplex carlsbadense 2-9-1]
MSDARAFDTGSDRLRGASTETVRRALADGDPLSGTAGFAGSVDGRVVRDVLGRQPVFTEADDPSAWSFDPAALSNPATVPAGHVRGPDGDERVWTLPNPRPATDERAAVRAVRSAVRGAIDDTATEGLAVAFSGGVDSAALAARLDAPLYVAGFPESHDVEAARTAAAKLDRDLRVVEVTHGDIERAVPEVAGATRRANAMDVSIALPLYLVAERAASEGFDRLAVGQGADELFGGYAKVARAPEDDRVAADTVRGARREVVGTLPDQLERDVLALRGAGVEPVAPLLSDRVVAAALDLPGGLLVTDRGERKWALRLAVREWVPDPVAFREKKAVQYGSLVSRELDRLARQAGFKRRMDDHVGQYVDSLRRVDGANPE